MIYAWVAVALAARPRALALHTEIVPVPELVENVDLLLALILV